MTGTAREQGGRETAEKEAARSERLTKVGTEGREKRRLGFKVQCVSR